MTNRNAAQRQGGGMATTTKDNGGPAFPMPAGSSAYDGRPQHSHGPMAGMSLRDYFAAAALQGALAAKMDSEKSMNCGGEGSTYKRAMTSEELASYLWHVADAMLAARKAGE